MQRSTRNDQREAGVSKGLRIGLAAMVATGLMSVAPAVSAKDGDIIRRGSCSGQSDWKLKLSREDGMIEVEFEVDQNKNGREWRVVLRKDGDRFFRGIRTTKGPSGSFEVRKVTGNGAGDERITARARDLNSDEVCRGAATATF
jgi:hypothetical protein